MDNVKINLFYKDEDERLVGICRFLQRIQGC